MKGKKLIYKILILAAWLLVGSGMIVLLAAASKKQKQHLCKDVTITIKGDSKQVFIDKKEIQNQLKLTAKGSLINKPLSGISLSQLENRLKDHPWISKAQLYFDSRNILHVAVVERIPIARIFTTTGQTFYIDSTGHRMPLLENINLRLPIITNFTSAKKLHASDSLMLNDITRMVSYISAHLFWSAQIAQFDITHERTFEAIPVVGNHIIKLGTAEGFAKKLDKLYLFYQNIISKTGFDKYKAIDLQYQDQIIGVKRGTTSKIDSVQLKKNIEEMMKQSEAALADSLLVMQQKPPSEGALPTTTFYTTPPTETMSSKTNPDKKNINALAKSTISKNTNNKSFKIETEKPAIKKPLQTEKKQEKIIMSEQKPRAVMTRIE